MSRFLMDRGIFEKGLWQDLVRFRLFFFLVGNAVFKETKHMGDIILKRGQLIRSYRKLREDLEYVEEGITKRYGFETIRRSALKLAEDGRVVISESPFGSLFTVVNYEQYQAFPESIKQPAESGCESSPSQLRVNKNKDKLSKLNTPLTPQGESEGFETFWKEWPSSPHKKRKAAAKRFWERKKLDKIAATVIDAVKRLKTTETWLKQNGQFIPGPANFLKDELWTDEIEDSVPQPAVTKRWLRIESHGTFKCNLYPGHKFEAKNFTYDQVTDELISKRTGQSMPLGHCAPWEGY